VNKDWCVRTAFDWCAGGGDDYTPDMPDEEILRRLLKLNLERAEKQH